MGYRGKLAEQQQARQLRRTGLPLTGIPPVQFKKPYRAVPDPSIRHAKHVHGCVSIDYSCSSTHRSIMGLVAALLSDDVTPG
jgi:hypothetical protein